MYNGIWIPETFAEGFAKINLSNLVTANCVHQSQFVDIDGHAACGVAYAEPIKYVEAVRTKLNAGADFAEHRSALQHCDVEAFLRKSERGRQATDASAGDDNGFLRLRSHGRSSWGAVYYRREKAGVRQMTPPARLKRKTFTCLDVRLGRRTNPVRAAGPAGYRCGLLRAGRACAPYSLDLSAGAAPSISPAPGARLAAHASIPSRLPLRASEVSPVCRPGWSFGAPNPLFPIALARRRWWRGRNRSTQRAALHPLVGELVSPSERQTVLKSDRSCCILARTALWRSVAHGGSGSLAFRKSCPWVSVRWLNERVGYIALRPIKIKGGDIILFRVRLSVRGGVGESWHRRACALASQQAKKVCDFDPIMPC